MLCDGVRERVVVLCMYIYIYIAPFLKSLPIRSIFAPSFLAISFDEQMARGQGRGAAKAAAKAKAKAAAQRNRGAQTTQQRAQQKIRENLRHIGDDSLYIRVLPATGRTLLQQVVVDLDAKAAGKDIKFGHLYYEALTQQYSADDSTWSALRPNPEDDTPVDPKLIEVAAEQN